MARKQFGSSEVLQMLDDIDSDDDNELNEPVCDGSDVEFPDPESGIDG